MKCMNQLLNKNKNMEMEQTLRSLSKYICYVCPLYLGSTHTHTIVCRLRVEMNASFISSAWLCVWMD